MVKKCAGAEEPTKDEIEVKVEIEYIDVRDLPPDRLAARQRAGLVFERIFREAERRELQRNKRAGIVKNGHRKTEAH